MVTLSGLLQQDRVVIMSVEIKLACDMNSYGKHDHPADLNQPASANPDPGEDGRRPSHFSGAGSLAGYPKALWFR